MGEGHVNEHANDMDRVEWHCVKSNHINSNTLGRNQTRRLRPNATRTASAAASRFASAAAASSSRRRIRTDCATTRAMLMRRSDWIFAAA